MRRMSKADMFDIVVAALMLIFAVYAVTAEPHPAPARPELHRSF